MSCVCQWPTAASSGRAAEHFIHLPFLPRQNLMYYLNLAFFSAPSSDCPVQGQCPAALCRVWGQGLGSELPLSEVLWLCRLQNLAPARKKSNNFLLVLQADSSQVPEDDVSAQSWWGRAGHQKSQLFPTPKFSSSLKTERRTKLLKELNVLSNLQLI